MIEGCLIAESLKPGTVLEHDEPLRILRVQRVAVGDAEGEPQPGAWTLMYFEAAEAAADALAALLADCLIPEGGWYADFTVGEFSHVVVFAGKVFRYRRDDPVGRLAAVQYGRQLGVPEQQLDWRD